MSLSTTPFAPVTWPVEAGALFRQALTCEYASLTRDGRPVTWPVTPYLDGDATTIDVSTGLTYPSKAERARRDPRVTLLFSDPRGSGLQHPPTVLVQGMASVRDADLQANTDRYVRLNLQKLPEATRQVPWFVAERQAWYWARIWIEVTPLQMWWWPEGRLDAEPVQWRASAGVTAPPSDPAPAGPPPAPWATPPVDWRHVAARARDLGNPVLTVRDPLGWPLPLRSRGVRAVDDGFVVDLPRLPGDAHLDAGAACLTFHTHPEVFVGQEHAVFVGTAEPDGEGSVHMRVDRALADFSLGGGALRLTWTFLSNGRKLAHEAARRGQAVPEVRRPH